MYECYSCTRAFRTRQSRNQHMDDTNHWSFECDTCTKEFSSQYAKEQHMTDVGHWARRRQTSWATPSLRPFQTSTHVGNYLEDNRKDDSVTNDALEIPEINGLSCRQQELISCIASMFNQTAHADITMLIRNLSLPTHRFIICPQSLYLEKVCHQAFNRGERTLNCDQGSGAAYWRVFEYLYTGDYSDPLLNTDLEDDPGLSKHLRVYALADIFCIEDLKTISFNRIQREISERWDRNLFLACIGEVYRSVPKLPHTLRSALLDVAVMHAHDIAVKEDFKGLIWEGGYFVVEYVERLLQL